MKMSPHSRYGYKYEDLQGKYSENMHEMYRKMQQLEIHMGKVKVTMVTIRAGQSIANKIKSHYGILQSQTVQYLFNLKCDKIPVQCNCVLQQQKRFCAPHIMQAFKCIFKNFDKSPTFLVYVYFFLIKTRIT